MRATRVSLLRVVLLFVALAISFKVTFTLSALPQSLYAEANVPDAPGSISGVARNAAGEPLADITVSLLGRDDLLQNFDPYGIVDTVTKADGSYRFSLLGPGLYYVKFSDSKHVYATSFYSDTIDPGAAILIPIAGNHVTGIDAVMQSGGQITGTITTSQGITPTYVAVQLLQNFTLSNGPYWYSMRTITLEQDTQEYTFGALSPGEYRICAEAFQAPIQGWYECYDNVSTIERATTITLTTAAVLQGQTIPNINIRLGDGADRGTIRGRVLNANNEPLTQITARLIPAPTVIPAPTAPAVELPTPYNGTGANTSRLAVPPSGPSPSALDQQTSFPLYPTAQTDAAGYYTFTAISPNQYILAFYDESRSYATEYYPDTYLFDDAALLSIVTNTLYPADDMVLQRGGQITGTITVLGEPAYSGSVSAFLEGKFGRGTSFDGAIDPKTGTYAIDGLPAGRYRIAADVRTGSATYYAFYPNGETIDDGEDVLLGIGQIQSNINMDLVNGPHYDGAIKGHVRAEGKALAGIRVELLNGCCSPRIVTYTSTDATGAYGFEGIQENSVWTVAFVDPTGRYGRTFAGNSATLEGAAYYSAIADIDTNVDGDLPRGGALRGRIYRNNGQPVADLQAMLYLMLDGRAYQVANDTKTLADGTFDLGGLRAGAYRLCFNQPRTGKTECFSNIDGLGNAFRALDVPVTIDQITEVNMVWGPDYYLHLPLVRR